MNLKNFLRVAAAQSFLCSADENTCDESFLVAYDPTPRPIHACEHIGKNRNR